MGIERRHIDEAARPSISPKPRSSASRYQKVVDRRYVKNGRSVALEVKSTLEFNALAAALVEGLLLRCSSPDTAFGVVSLCAKGKVMDIWDDLAVQVCPGANVMLMVPDRPGGKKEWRKEYSDALASNAKHILKWANGKSS